VIGCMKVSKLGDLREHVMCSWNDGIALKDFINCASKNSELEFETCPDWPNCLTALATHTIQVSVTALPVGHSSYHYPAWQIYERAPEVDLSPRM
jgi:hypothetical protein